MKIKTKVAAFSLCFFAIFACQCFGSLILNGDFETGDFTSWSVTGEGESSLNVPNPLPVLLSPSPANLGPSPTNDFYAFSGNQNGPSQNIFTQSFVVPSSGLSQAMLSFDYTYENYVDFINPAPDDTLDYLDGNTPNQQFRVEILKGTAAFDSVNTTDIVFSALQTAPLVVPLTQSWTNFSQDISAELTPFLGQTLQVRFAQADNAGPFDIGFDNVSLEVTVVNVNPGVVPEPGTLAIFGTICLAACGRRRMS